MRGNLQKINLSISRTIKHPKHLAADNTGISNFNIFQTYKKRLLFPRKKNLFGKSDLQNVKTLNSIMDYFCFGFSVYNCFTFFLSFLGRKKFFISLDGKTFSFPVFIPFLILSIIVSFNLFTE